MIKRIQKILFACLVLIQSSLLYSQPVNWSSMIEEWRKEYNVPGMSVGIIRNGEVVYEGGAGVLEAGKTQKTDQHTLYSIASNTKAFISASIAVLVKEGKIKWDDKVKTYLPYFELYDPCVSEMMTIRDLLCHRSGLGTFSGDVIWYRSNYSAEEVVKRSAEIDPQFEFRSGFGYSNVMYLAAGEVIKAVSGKPWDVFVKEKFITPLHMDRTITSTSAISKTTNVASPHKPEGDENNPIPWVNWDNMGAAGGIISSADDMLKWIRFQLDHGITGTDTVFNRMDQMQMWTPHNNHVVSERARELFGNRNFNGYGLGWGVSEYNGYLLVSHTGGYDGMYSAVMMLPTQKTGVVILTNSMTSIGSMLGYEIMDKLFGFAEGEWKVLGLNQDEGHWKNRSTLIKQRTDAHKEGTQPTMKAGEISGLYRCPMFGDIRILEDRGQLVMDFVSSPQLKAKLTHWHYDTYRLDWIEEQAWFEFGTVQIQQDNNGHPSRLLFDVPNDDIFFEEIKAVRVTP